MDGLRRHMQDGRLIFMYASHRTFANEATVDRESGIWSGVVNENVNIRCAPTTYLDRNAELIASRATRLFHSKVSWSCYRNYNAPIFIKVGYLNNNKPFYRGPKLIKKRYQEVSNRYLLSHRSKLTCNCYVCYTLLTTRISGVLELIRKQ